MIPYLRLVRLPNVFTALADILAGSVIMAAPGERRWTALVLGGASAGLYLAGMAFNDLADREEDARVRPNRPIPSGAVTVKGAATCGVWLMLGGIALAAIVGVHSAITAILLALWILAYDFATKGITVAGPLTLGLCRVTNVLLGMSAAPHFAEAVMRFNPLQPPWAPALSVGIYAAGLTAFSAQEESGKQLRAILLGWLFCGAAIALAGISSPSPLCWIALGPLTALLLHLTFKLKHEGTPIAARNLVRTGVMGVCAVDAGLILGFGGAAAWPYAVASVLLLAPAVLIAKWLAQKEA